MRAVVAFTIILFSMTSYAEQSQGWSLGLAAASQPQTLNVFPLLDYKTENWSLGTSGLRWSNWQEEGWNQKVQLAYPRSELSLAYEKGWQEYGLSAGHRFSNGQLVNLSVEALGLKVRIEQGIEDRKGEQNVTTSFTAPVLFPGKGPEIVLATIEYQLGDSDFWQSEYLVQGFNVLNQYDAIKAGLFAPWSIGDNITAITSVSYTFPGREAEAEFQAYDIGRFSLFVMISSAI